MNEVVDAFHREFYNSALWNTDTRWMGVPSQKCPLDLWVYQEILYELLPDLIIETGTAYGGTALFLAQMCELLGRGHVVSIDVVGMIRPQHPRLSYWLGPSTSQELIGRASIMASYAKTVLAILDSDHTKSHVLRELECYAPLVTVGSYIVVEDTDLNGHPVMPDHGPGPAEAVAEFLATHSNFQADRSREKFMMTQNPGGFLRRLT